MRHRSASLAVLAILLQTTLSGCISSGSDWRDAVKDAATGSAPKQNVPRECQRILKKVPDPGGQAGEKFAGVDWEGIAGRYRAAWSKGNKRIVKGADCENVQADKLAKGGT